MSDQRAVSLSNSDLDQLLIGLGPRIHFPPTPNLATSVRSHIVLTQPPPLLTWRRHEVWMPRRLALTAAILVIVVTGLLIAFPDTRHSIARWLGIGPIGIVVIDETATPDSSSMSASPTPQASPVGVALALGEQMTLTEVQTLVGFPIGVPTRLGEPDEVYLRMSGADAVVSLVYRPREGLPAAPETGFGALLMYFPTEMQPGDVFKRFWDGQGTFDVVRIGADEGFWISGETELVIDLDPNLTVEEIIQRRSANVLIWEQGGVTYRLESALDVPESIAIAESLP